MPYKPIGAIGWMITMPMMIKFHNVNVRFSRGAELAVPSSLKQFSFSSENHGSNPASL